MKPPVFFQRKTLWVPTLAGFVVIATVIVTLSFFTLKNVAGFLSVNQPIGSGYLVVEGWLDPARLTLAKQAFEQGDYESIIVSGGPIINDFYERDNNYAVRAGNFLISTGMAAEQLHIVQSPYSAQDRTYLSAVMVREWFAESKITVTTLDVFSGGVHSRRTRDLYALAFNDVHVGIYSSAPTEYDPVYWWRTSTGAKAVVAELAGWLMASCCFNPGEKGSHWEKWAVEKGSPVDKSNEK